MTKKLAFLFLAITIVFSACRKDSDIVTTTTTGDPDVDSEIVTGNLIGNITDEYDNPVEGASIRLKSNTTFTDENGNFSLSNVQMEVDGALLTVNKAGYFEAFDRVRAKSNQTSYTRIQLLDRAIISSFPAGAAQDVTFDGATVKFQSNGFVDANGNDYNGTVNVAAHWIDPTDDNLDAQMPGDLRALDAENQSVALQSYGMVAVDLIADDGSDLQLKEGLSAEVSFPIPTDISNSAPAAIPLWSFDEEAGIWVEEGTASKVGNMYVGNVTHFSFWNCDAPFPLIEMEGQIVDENGDPIDQAYICIDFANSGGYGAGGYSNEEGYFGGKIPKDEPLILTVKDDCFNPIFTMEIGPFSDDVDLGQISVTSFSTYMVSLTGSLVNCDGDPVTNGYAKINTASSPYYQFPAQVDENGNWSADFLICQSDVQVLVSGYDLDALLTSNVSTYTASPGGGTIDVGTIEVCEELDEFLNVVGDTLVASFIDPQIGIDGDWHGIFSNGSATTDTIASFQLDYVGTGVGTFTQVSQISYNGYDPDNNIDLGYFCQGCNVVVEITTYEGPGGYIEGSYSGEANSWNGTVIDVNGEFRIRRD